MGQIRKTILLYSSCLSAFLHGVDHKKISHKINVIDTYISPNFNARSTPISHIVIHQMRLSSIQESLSILCDSNLKVSAHFLIDENGDTFYLVDTRNRAWHAGVSTWKGRNDVNDFSIGIELHSNRFNNGPLRPYPKAQMKALLVLLSYLCKSHNINQDNIVGHSDIAPGRKQDPGKLFNWKTLYRKGFAKGRLIKNCANYPN